MRVTRRAFVRGAGAASLAGFGGLAWSARGSEAAAGSLARGLSADALASGVLRLHSNESPVGPIDGVAEAVKDALRDAGRYPQLMGPGLVEDLARLHGATPENIALGCGSGEILQMAVDAFTTPARGLVAGLPTFESPAGRARRLGRPLVEVPVDPTSLHLDLAGMARHAAGAGLVFFCNPNNPTGALHDARAVKAFIAAVLAASPEVVVLVDEAYHEYVDDPAYETTVPLALADPRVVVSRTFSKAYGMAGIRLGYAVGHASTMRTLSAWRLGNSVNLLAFAAGRAALAAGEALPRERQRNHDVREYTARTFRDLGFTVAPSQANFVLVDIRRDARGFQDVCRERGVMVGRPFPPLDTWTRVSIGTMDEMRRAAPIFADVLRTPATAAVG